MMSLKPWLRLSPKLRIWLGPRLGPRLRPRRLSSRLRPSPMLRPGLGQKFS